MRNYAKSNPEKTAFLQPEKNVEEKVVPSSVTIKDAGANYRKEEGALLPKSFFVIISGGEKTERLYFKIIANQDRFERIKIEFIADAKQLNPKGLLDTAIYKQEHYKTSQEDEPDKIYIVSDVDDFMSELLEIKPDCEKLNISLIVSNSYFEIWIYYAYFENITGFVMPENNLQISKSFRRWMPSNVNPVKAILNIEQNIKNAKTHYEEDENGIPKLFSTNMFVLAKGILPLIDRELKKLIAENERKQVKNKKTCP
ncbi:MAG: RloB family protein [Prevotellaceae bacterium]|jgi:hypothetical protein|nr:RloB family protein [Prevotellaceae bacterium]